MATTNAEKRVEVSAEFDAVLAANSFPNIGNVLDLVEQVRDAVQARYGVENSAAMKLLNRLPEFAMRIVQAEAEHRG